MIKIVYSFFNFVPCHRKIDRCLHIKGVPMPICARCFSILLGYLFIPLLFLFYINFFIGIVLQIPMLIDGFTQLYGKRISNNYLRVITGLMSGFGISICIVSSVRFLT